MRPSCSFIIMPLHPWQFHHLALGNRKGRGERISSLQRAVRDIMGEDWNVRIRSWVTNVVDVYMDVPTDHQLDLELNAMAVLWEFRKEGQSVRRLQHSRSTSTWYCPWAKIVSPRKTLGAPHPIDFSLQTPGNNDWSSPLPALRRTPGLLAQLAQCPARPLRADCVPGGSIGIPHGAPVTKATRAGRPGTGSWRLEPGERRNPSPS